MNWFLENVIWSRGFAMFCSGWNVAMLLDGRTMPTWWYTIWLLYGIVLYLMVVCDERAVAGARGAPAEQAGEKQ